MGTSRPFPHRWCRHWALLGAAAGTDRGFALLAGAISAAALLWWWLYSGCLATSAFVQAEWLMERRVENLEEAVGDLVQQSEQPRKKGPH